MSRFISRLASSVARARAASSALALTTLLTASLAACGADSATGPQVQRDVQEPRVVATSGTITGTISLVPGLPGSLANARVAIYSSVADRRADRIVRQVALGNTGPNYAFTLTDVAPGTYYMDVCFLPVSDANCRNPSPDNPITVIAGQATPVNLQMR